MPQFPQVVLGIIWHCELWGVEVKWLHAGGQSSVTSAFFVHDDHDQLVKFGRGGEFSLLCCTIHALSCTVPCFSWVNVKAVYLPKERPVNGVWGRYWSSELVIPSPNCRYLKQRKKNEIKLESFVMSSCCFMLVWVSVRAQTSEIAAQRHTLNRNKLRKKSCLFCAASHVICHLTAQESGCLWELLVEP